MTLEVVAVEDGHAVFRIGMQGRKELVAFFVRASDAHQYRDERFIPSCYEVRAAVFEGDLLISEDPRASHQDLRACSTTEAPPPPPADALTHQDHDELDSRDGLTSGERIELLND